MEIHPQNIRRLISFLQAVINPAIAVLITHWIPPAERSTVIGLYTGGKSINFSPFYDIYSCFFRKSNRSSRRYATERMALSAETTVRRMALDILRQRYEKCKLFGIKS